MMKSKGIKILVGVLISLVFFLIGCMGSIIFLNNVPGAPFLSTWLGWEDPGEGVIGLSHSILSQYPRYIINMLIFDWGSSLSEVTNESMQSYILNSVVFMAIAVILGIIIFIILSKIGKASLGNKNAGKWFTQKYFILPILFWVIILLINLVVNVFHWINIPQYIPEPTRIWYLMLAGLILSLSVAGALSFFGELLFKNYKILSKKISFFLFTAGLILVFINLILGLVVLENFFRIDGLTFAYTRAINYYDFLVQNAIFYLVSNLFIVINFFGYTISLLYNKTEVSSNMQDNTEKAL
ncbi:hypothetical protein DSAG12_00427 [Promethearchaeum syntrophicum]|uniref:Uncharacterized protein n=1 Tax=Promethearchaeum syntrophicum TaxID=2594042 RepID=A0A5B9D696_9ARCH|nr:hypothetical protein [Candidatus Prometheoarchaeum syntrophicum]QEE14614.1 hypothetical protein DSAG12_00427 [Candidatus Prometheoarchaeum syntrophicum]